MPRTRFSAPSKWATPFVALIIAIVIHLLFFSLFTHKKVKNNNDNSKSTKSGVSILNITSIDNEEKEDFYNWLKVHDPKNYFDSKNPSNFTALFPKKKTFREVTYSMQPISIERKIPEITKFTPNTIQTIKHHKYSYIEQNLSMYGLYPTSQAYINAKQNVLILNSSGKAIKDLTLPLPPNVSSNKPTIIKITSNGSVERLTLIKSSNNHQLDAIALAAVRRLKHTKEDKSYTFYWPLIDTKSQENSIQNNENKK